MITTHASPSSAGECAGHLWPPCLTGSKGRGDECADIAYVQKCFAYMYQVCTCVPNRPARCCLYVNLCLTPSNSRSKQDMQQCKICTATRTAVPCSNLTVEERSKRNIFLPPALLQRVCHAPEAWIDSCWPDLRYIHTPATPSVLPHPLPSPLPSPLGSFWLMSTNVYGVC